MDVDAKGFPARCLACDGAKPSNLAYLCSHCVRYSDFNLHDAAAEWKAGDRAFPRGPRIPRGEAGEEVVVGQRRRWNADVKGAGNRFTVEAIREATGGNEATVEYRYDDGTGPFGYTLKGVLLESRPDQGEPASAVSTASESTVARLSCVECGRNLVESVRHARRDGGWACVKCQAKVAKAPPRREVSTNGRDWLPYERLVDSDPFEAYKHRRLDGVVVAMEEPRGYGGLTFAQHAENDRLIHPGGIYRKRTPIAWDLDPTPGANTPQTHAYSTPSQRTR